MTEQQYMTIKILILKEIARDQRVSQYYVLEEIKNRIHPTVLYNKAIEAGRDTTDGIENLQRGAEAFLEEFLSRDNDVFRDEDGFIRLTDGAYANH